MAVPPLPSQPPPLAAHVPSWLPMQDPTALTTAAVDRAVLSLTAMIEREIAAFKEMTEVRFSTRDEAIRLLSENTSRVPTEITKQVDHINGLFTEKFTSVALQFTERDVRMRTSDEASKLGIAAALQAQKEAAASQQESNSESIRKSEAATTKQIDNIIALLANATKTTDDKINLINERLNRGEGALRGGMDTRTESRQNVVALVAIGGFIFAVVSGFVGFNLKGSTTGPQSYTPPPGYTLVPKP